METIKPFLVLVIWIIIWKLVIHPPSSIDRGVIPIIIAVLVFATTVWPLPVYSKSKNKDKSGGHE